MLQFHIQSSESISGSILHASYSLTGYDGVQVFHTYDYRFQDGYSRQRVAAMYLPLMHYMAAKVLYGYCGSTCRRLVSAAIYRDMVDRAVSPPPIIF